MAVWASIREDRRQPIRQMEREARAKFEPAHDFDAALRQHGCETLARDSAPETLQVNVGKLCNQACHHCHVDAGPKRTEIMTHAIAQRVVELVGRSSSVKTVDITGGAPELNPNFRLLVEQTRALERSVTVRCNLTVMFEPGMEWLGDFYRRHQVALVCSLPIGAAATAPSSPLEPQDMAMIGFALKLMREPSSVKRQDLDLLKQRGFSEEQVIDCCAYHLHLQFHGSVGRWTGRRARSVYATAGRSECG